MRILIVSQYFWPETFRINDLALGLKQRGHAVEVLTGMPNYPGGKLYPGYSACSPATESSNANRAGDSRDIAARLAPKRPVRMR